MVIVRKVPAQVQRTAQWLSAELDLAESLAQMGFFSSDDDAGSSSSSCVTPVEIRRGPKKRYGGVAARKQPQVNPGLIRDFGRKRVGWRRQRRLDNELTIVHGRADVEIEVEEHLRGSDATVELMSAPPSAPLASLFRDSDALKKWQEFAQQNDDEQQRQLAELFHSEQRFAANFGAGDGESEQDDYSKPQNFRKALGAAKKQLRKVSRPLCRQLRRLASPALMASIENELLARMGEVAAESIGTTASKLTSGPCPVTLVWKTANLFKAYTEKITLDALCRYYDYQLSWPSAELETVSEIKEETEEDSFENKMSTSPDASSAVHDDLEMETVVIFSKNWRWPPVRLANIFFLNQQQQQSVF